jgi:hypothetical protein
MGPYHNSSFTESVRFSKLVAVYTIVIGQKIFVEGKEEEKGVCGLSHLDRALWPPKHI